MSGFKLAASYSREKNRSKGGACIFVRSNIIYKELPRIRDLTIPYVFELCGINLNGTYILCIYRPKKVKNDNFIKNMENVLSIVQKHKEHKIIICGDFNVDILMNSSETREFRCLAESYGLNININQPTRITSHSSTCLDNILSNVALGHAQVTEIGLSDHTLQYADLAIPVTKQVNFYTLIRDTKEENLLKLKNYLHSLAWEDVYRSLDCDTAFNVFHDILINAFNAYCPEIRVRTGNTRNDRGWITPGIKKSCDTKRKLFIELKTTKNSDLIKRYKLFCSILNRVISYSKRTFNENKIMKSDDKVKATWNLINQHVKGTKQIEVNSYIGLTDGNKKLLSDTGAPDLFNNFFNNNAGEAKIGSGTDDSDQINRPTHSSNTMFSRPTTLEELHKTIHSLKNKKSCGYDNIPTSVIKFISEAIAGPLMFLINLSLSQGKFPARLKKAHIKPIHKKDDKLDVNNYRPISLLVTLSKIFEKIMISRLRSFLVSNSVLAREQFGFQKGVSTNDAIFDMADFVAEALDHRQIISTVLLDLSKAFDHVDHETLLDILDRYGIRGTVNDWFRSYLQDREQSVLLPVINQKHTMVNMESEVLVVRRGVPQGSILGPLLFLLYVNHLPNIINEKIIMFADDVSVFFKFDKDTVINRATVTSESIQNIITWFKQLNLSTNVNKTKMLHFRNYNTPKNDLVINYNDSIIESVPHAKFLGIYVDEYLNWKKHIEMLESRLSSFCYALRSLSYISTSKACLESYFAFFQSRILYGLAVWGGSVHIGTIFLLQKRCIRILDGLKSNRESCRESFKKLNIHTITSLYVIELCKLVKRYPSKFPPRPQGPSNRLNERLKFDLEVPQTRTSTYSRTVKIAAIKTFNSLPEDIKSLTGTKFFWKLKTYLLQHCPYSLNEFYELNKING